VPDLLGRPVDRYCLNILRIVDNVKSDGRVQQVCPGIMNRPSTHPSHGACPSVSRSPRIRILPFLCSLGAKDRPGIALKLRIPTPGSYGLHDALCPLFILCRLDDRSGHFDSRLVNLERNPHCRGERQQPGNAGLRRAQPAGQRHQEGQQGGGQCGDSLP